jgi:arylsulfatase A-like enzyme
MGRQHADDAYPPLPLMRDEEAIQMQPDQAAITERYVEESLRFIRANQERPFFLYFAHMYVHVPIYAPESFMQASENGRYGAGVMMIDWSVGMLLHEIKRLGLEENTLVIFTSDNGSRARDEGGSNAPLRAYKGTTWEGGQRVPCIMRWPAQIPAGRVCNEVITMMDLCPTLAALAGTAAPTDRIIDGKDIRPLLIGEAGATSPHEAFFYYIMNHLMAVRVGKWKLHVNSFDWSALRVVPMTGLYDLENDIGETTDLYDQHPEIVAALEARLAACRQDLGDASMGVVGQNIRPVGQVETPTTLTTYDPDHPYLIALYDLKDRG